MSATPSPYFPLRPGFIRLLRINHGFLHCRETPETFLNWEFVHSFPGGDVPYLAVSYVWGRDPAMRQLDSRSYRDAPVTVTLSALKVLQHLTEQYEPPFHVWIDALCIDQNNVAEKRDQLPRMREIYSNAVQVIAWLGEAPDADGAFKVMDMITSYSRDSTRHLRLDPSTPKPYSCQCRRDKGRSILTMLSPLLDLQWFYRMWIVQEVVKGSCVLMLCTAAWGDFKELLWDDLYLYLLDHNVLNFAPDAKASSRTYASGNACILAGRRHVDRFIKAGAPLESALTGNTPLQTLLTEVAPYFGATEPRDKIYALLGLSSDLTFSDFEPAYTVPVESVFTQAAELILVSGKSACPSPLALLSFAGIGAPRNLGGLPTWVPDWTAAARRITFNQTAWVTEGTYFGAVAERAGYNTTSGVVYKPPVILRNPQSRKCLALRGIVLDTANLVASRYPAARSLPVSKLGDDASVPSRYSTSWDAPYAIRTWLAQARDLANSVMPYYQHTHESADVLLSRTLAGDLRQDFEPWSSVHGTTCVVELGGSYAAFFRTLEMPRGPSSNTDIDRAAHFVAAFERHGADRVLFTTGGGLLGLAAEGVQPGDRVVLLCGAKVPFLLRPVTGSGADDSVDEFQLVSECYVRGIMHGEAVGFGVEQHIVLV
jgi:hypothetical protein